MTTPMTLHAVGGLPISVIAAEVYIPWRGAWILDAVLDATTPALVPLQGKATALVGGVSLVGTIDPAYAGTFQSKAAVRLVGGAGAWDQPVPAQDFVNDAGVSSTQVYSQTGAVVGETVNDLVPTTLGTRYERTAGPASRVLARVDWWIDFTGVTNVGARPAGTADGSLVIVDFDTVKQRVEFSSDALLVPNTALSDDRFNGASPMVRDVTQTFDASGSHGSAMCSAAAVSRPFAVLESAIVELSGRTFSRSYRYRFVQLQGDRWGLQATNPGAGQPDVLSFTPTGGLFGLTQKPSASQELWIAFESGDPTLPYIASYSALGLPLETTIDASTSVNLGPSATSVALAGGGHSVAFADKIFAELNKISQTLTSLVGEASFGTPYVPPTDASEIGSEITSSG